MAMFKGSFRVASNDKGMRIFMNGVLRKTVLAFGAAAAAAVLSLPAQAAGASWYGPGFHGKRTASGERFNTNAMTAAHRSLPFGTRVRVTNSRTGRSVVVRINDRGPFHGGRAIDLSHAAARAIGMGGTANVALAVMR